jgi:hypothetical protein
LTGKIAPAVCAVLLLSGIVAVAEPTPEAYAARVDASAYAHSIHNRADAHSQIFIGKADIKPDLGIGFEAARISDADGRTVLGNVYLRRPIPLKDSKRTYVEGYAGVSGISVKDIFDNRYDDTGLSFGAAADYNVSRDFTLYGRAGIALLDQSIWTLDAGLRYEVRPLWYLTMGYRGYVAGGSSFGGLLVGATYRADM